MTISLIVPIFNVEKYIGECLNNIVNQTVPFDEVILVDDGSTDDSYGICKEYSKKFSNIILIHQDNQGQGKARNIGIDLASSDYIMFCDSDDYYNRHICEKMHQEWEMQDIEVGLFDAVCIYEDGFASEVNPYDRSWIQYKEEMNGEEYFIITYPRIHIVSPCLMMLKKEFLIKNNIEFPIGMFYEDNVFFIKILLSAKIIRYMPEKLYYRRYRQGSTMTSAINNKKMNDKIGIIKQIQKLLLEEFQKEGSGMQMFMSYYWNLYGDFLYECLENKSLLDKKRWASLIYESYRESSQLWINNKYSGNSLSILGEHCLILDLLKKLGVKINDRKYHELRSRYTNKIIKLLTKIPLQNEKIVVGIYGVGKQTDYLIETYEKLFGKIKCKIIYLETKVEKGKKYKSQQVYCIKDIISELSIIIISSLRYQDNMIENVMNTGTNIEIFTLYDKNESREIKLNLLLE